MIWVTLGRHVVETLRKIGYIISVFRAKLRVIARASYQWNMWGPCCDVCSVCTVHRQKNVCPELLYISKTNITLKQKKNPNNFLCLSKWHYFELLGILSYIFPNNWNVHLDLYNLCCWWCILWSWYLYFILCNKSVLSRRGREVCYPLSVSSGKPIFYCIFLPGFSMELMWAVITFLSSFLPHSNTFRKFQVNLSIHLNVTVVQM